MNAFLGCNLKIAAGEKAFFPDGLVEGFSVVPLDNLLQFLLIAVWRPFPFVVHHKQMGREGAVAQEERDFCKVFCTIKLHLTLGINKRDATNCLNCSAKQSKDYTFLHILFPMG